MKKSKNVTGNYYIRVRPTGWYLWYQFYKEGKRFQEKVDKKAYHDFGFKPEMSVDEARARCTQLNKERSFIKEKIRLSAKRVTELITVDETLFPQDALDDFKDLLKDENFGSDEHLEKLYSHFNFIQTMCNELRILPVEYKEESRRIYKYFIKKKISINYCGRIISVMNRWGKFQCKKTGTFFDPIEMPRGREKSAIADAQQTKSGKDTELGVRTESLPLHPHQLEDAKDNLSEEQYNWLFISVWFGLRPEEVDLLKQPKRYRVEYDPVTKVDVLFVYQSKLQSIAEQKRWKYIPIIFPEQEKCLELIKSQKFLRPLHKTVRKYVGRGITLYGGRKGFVDLMLSKGQVIEDISIWLGHKDISTTWTRYKDKKQISFTKAEPGKLKVVK